MEDKIISAIDGLKANMATKDDLKGFVKAEQLEGLAKAEDLNKLNEAMGAIKMEKAKPTSTIGSIAKGIADNFEADRLAVKKFKVPFMTKEAGTMTSAASLTGDTVITYDSQLAANPYRNVHMRDLVRIIPSATGVYSWYRQTATDGAIAFQTNHGTKKSLINMTLEQDSVTAEYLAGLAPVAKQMMQDLPFLQGEMPSFMINEYLTKEDSEFFADLINEADGDDTTTGTNEIEKIMEWVANLRAADYSPNGIVIHPSDVYKIFITQVGDAGYTLPPGVVVSNAGLITIFGIPVYQSTFVTAGFVMVGDWTKAGIVQVDGLAILTDDRGDNFDNNTVTFKAEARVALAVTRPDAFIYGELDPSV
jgi:HK97 family phage major capsid protein